MEPTTPGPFLEPPICLALVLAQDVSHNQEGVLRITGPFISLFEEQFPIEYGTIQAYVVLTGCDGDVMVELLFVDSEESRQPIFRQLISARFDGPNDLQQIIFRQFKVSIPAPGDYRFVLNVLRANLTHREFVAHHFVHISQTE